MNANNAIRNSRRAVLAAMLTLCLGISCLAMPAGAIAQWNRGSSEAASSQAAISTEAIPAADNQATGSGEETPAEKIVPKIEPDSTEQELLEKQAELEQTVTDLQKQVSALESQIQENKDRTVKAVVPAWIGVATGVFALIVSLGTLILVLHQPENQSMSKQDVEQTIRDAIGSQLKNLTPENEPVSQKAAQVTVKSVPAAKPAEKPQPMSDQKKSIGYLAMKNFRWEFRNQEGNGTLERTKEESQFILYEDNTVKWNPSIRIAAYPELVKTYAIGNLFELEADGVLLEADACVQKRGKAEVVETTESAVVKLREQDAYQVVKKGKIRLKTI